MANFSKPTSIPRWADTGVIVVPSTAKQDAGWVAPELPPDTFFNWHQNLVGQWVKWLDERMFDGTTDDDFKIQAPPNAGGSVGAVLVRSGDGGSATDPGGTAILEAGNGGATSGNGGIAVVRGGIATVGTGGNVDLYGGSGSSVGGSITANAGSAQVGVGGSVSLKAGSSLLSGGLASLSGGDVTGTDINGGSVTLSSGVSRGTGSSSVLLKAAISGGTGAFARNPETFITCDGSIGKITAVKTIKVNTTNNDIGIEATGAGTGVGITSTGGSGNASGAILIGGGTGSTVYGAEARGSADSGGSRALLVKATENNPALVGETPAASAGGSSNFIKADWGTVTAVAVDLTNSSTATRLVSLNTTGGAGAMLINCDGTTNAAGLFVDMDASSSQAGVEVSHVGSGKGALIDSSSGTGIAVHALSGSGTAVLADSASGIALFADSSSGSGVAVHAKADLTSPVRGALRLEAQDADPSSPLEGDFSIHSTTGKLSIYDGNDSARYVPQLFASVASDTISTTGSEVAYTEKHTIPANTLRVGSTIRIRAWGSGSSSGLGTNDEEVFVRFGAAAVPLYTRTDVDWSSNAVSWYIDVTVTVRTLGASADLRSGGMMGTDVASSAVDRLYTDVNSVTANTTINNDITVAWKHTGTSVSNTLIGFVVDVT